MSCEFTVISVVLVICVTVCSGIASNFTSSDNGNFIPSLLPTPTPSQSGTTTLAPPTPYGPPKSTKIYPAFKEEIRKSSKTFSSYGPTGTSSNTHYNNRDAFSSPSIIHPTHHHTGHSGYGDSGESGVAQGHHDFGVQGLYGTSGYGYAGGFNSYDKHKPVADYHFHEHHGGDHGHGHDHGHGDHHGHGDYHGHDHSSYGGGYHGDHHHGAGFGESVFFGKALALKTLLLPLAGVALLGAAAAFVSNPVLLQLGVVSGKRRRRDLSSNRKWLTKEDFMNKKRYVIYPRNDQVKPDSKE